VSIEGVEEEVLRGDLRGKTVLEEINCVEEEVSLVDPGVETVSITTTGAKAMEENIQD